MTRNNIACDSSCASCSTSPPTCTSCADSTKLLLNGACVAGPSCPTGYFATTTANATTQQCLPCHPDCATCSGSFDACSSCPASRPVLSSSKTCVQTCASNEFYDTAKGSCTACSSSCATCSGSASSQCLSCPSTSTLKQGTCKPVDCTIVPSFGVCLSDLVTVSAQSAASTTATHKALPWWTILLIIIVVILLIGAVLLVWRARDQKRRREQTERFRDNLGKREVELKLQQLPHDIAYPPPVPARQSVESDLASIVGPGAQPDKAPKWEYEDMLRRPTVQFAVPPARSASPASTVASVVTRQRTPESHSLAVEPLEAQATGASIYSQSTGKSIVSASGKTIHLGSRNPFNRYA